MNLLEVFAIAIGLAMDTFAVAIATSISLGRVSGRQLFRFSWHFGLFQAIMPVLGWTLGQTVAVYISAIDHWFAFALLTYVGGKAIWAAFKEGPETHAPKSDPTRGASLIMLSLATSIDAFAVGLSFAFLDMAIWYPAVIIGAVTGLITLSGMLLGSKLGSKLGKHVEILGGLILIGIGLKILLEHLAQL
jgi:putative Mn2+ efflux pump MntP